MHLSAEEAALVGTIYSPPLARRPWMLADVLPSCPLRYYSLARWALVDALRVCGVRAGDRVLVPGLICREVLASLCVVGASADFYSVSTTLEAAFVPGSLEPAKAILAVNYFGVPQDLEPFRDYCRRTGAALIEDNAHGLFSRDRAGEWLGSRGDVGIYSFRKSIAVPSGAALVVNGDRWQPPAELPSVHGFDARYKVKQAFRRVAGALGPVRTFDAIGIVRRARRVSTGDALPLAPPDAQERIPGAPNPDAMLSRSLSVADPDFESRRRRGLYELVGPLVVAVGGIRALPALSDNVVPYGFPFFAPPARMSVLAAALRRLGLPLAQWPELPLAVAPVAPDHYRDLHVVPFLW